MAQDRFNLGRHFIYWHLDDLIEMYEKRKTVIHIVKVDFNDPLLSVVVLERKERGDA